jgi:hypothetical protein
MAFGLKWKANAHDERGRIILVKYARTQAQARKDVKSEMMSWSVRGILCGKCNYGLGCVERFFDAAAHPENLLPVIEYLKNRLT